MQAVAARLMADTKGAEARLSEISDIQPASGRVAQEHGLMAMADNRPADALAHFILATRYNPGLLQSWKRRATLHAQFGHGDGVKLCEKEIVMLGTLPAELQMAKTLYHEDALFKAEIVCKNFMQKNPKNIDGMLLLADIATALGASEEAEFLLSSAVEFAPDAPRVRIDNINAVKKRQNFDVAFAQAN